MINNYSKMMSLVLLLLLASCAKKMDETYVPSYISIHTINILTGSGQGSSSSSISDAWVYLDGEDRGAYPLPANIPLLAEGVHSVKIAPGIKLNGIAGTRVPYPMVEPIEIDVDLVKDSIVPLELSTHYYSSSKFAIVDGFEDVNQAFETTINNEAEWTRSNSEDPPSYVFEGFHSGMGVMDEDHSYLQIITKQMFTELPKHGVPVFIELDFKTDVTMVLSITGYNQGIGESKDLIFLNPTEEWKKIYINLTSELSYDINTHDYKFLFSAIHNPSFEESVMLIDNFKIVYREVE